MKQLSSSISSGLSHFKADLTHKAFETLNFVFGDRYAHNPFTSKVVSRDMQHCFQQTERGLGHVAFEIIGSRYLDGDIEYCLAMNGIRLPRMSLSLVHKVFEAMVEHLGIELWQESDLADLPEFKDTLLGEPLRAVCYEGHQDRSIPIIDAKDYDDALKKGHAVALGYIQIQDIIEAVWEAEENGKIKTEEDLVKFLDKIC